ncbi:hypothetical protein B5X24_HaOG212939 [Helicoverpa armigera]|nr:hypothetical protein B5X24_HaOG212939 [Helicoverpa armigera]
MRTYLIGYSRTMNTCLVRLGLSCLSDFDCIISSTNCILFITLSSSMARISKYLKFILHLSILTLLSYFIKDQKPARIVKKIGRYIPDMKHILMWTRVPGIDEDGQRYFISHGCEYINCYFTTNRSLFPDLRYFDAIVFNVQDVSRETKDLPKVRSIVQKFIFAANDSSDNYPVCSPVYEEYFNWTWTYK